MRTSTAIRYFGSRYALGKALGIKPPAVYKWGEFVPELRQLQLERITRGELKASRVLKMDLLPPRRKRPKKRKAVEAPPAPEPALVEASDA